MKRPSMIIFDYGGTLVKETSFDGLRGTKAMFDYAVSDYNIETVNKLNSLLGDGFQIAQRAASKSNLEYPYLAVQKFACDSVGVTFSMSDIEMEKVYWDQAGNADANEGAEELLEYLRNNHIRIGVISNIVFSGENLKKRLKEIFPDITFEFIITSSDYLYRKPDTHLFQLAISKASDINQSKIWYCGDQYDVDMNGAIQSGIMPIWLNSDNVNKSDVDERVISVNNLFRLKELIDRIC